MYCRYSFCVIIFSFYFDSSTSWIDQWGLNCIFWLTFFDKQHSMSTNTILWNDDSTKARLWSKQAPRNFLILINFFLLYYKIVLSVYDTKRIDDIIPNLVNRARLISNNTSSEKCDLCNQLVEHCCCNNKVGFTRLSSCEISKLTIDAGIYKQEQIPTVILTFNVDQDRERSRWNLDVHVNQQLNFKVFNNHKSD